jgi:hypothetical protein
MGALSWFHDMKD